ncbi:Inner membrane metabolite transport protein yhjE [Yersinia frederiksenii]|nr:Inner membrane metabolite transport protein yhjE [Yersinia frederiksenii]
MWCYLASKLPSMLGSGQPALVMAFLACLFIIMGLTFGPMGACYRSYSRLKSATLAHHFPINVASILGASVAPYISTWLATHYGLFYVGVYLASMATITLIALLFSKETRHISL